MYMQWRILQLFVTPHSSKDLLLKLGLDHVIRPYVIQDLLGGAPYTIFLRNASLLLEDVPLRVDSAQWYPSPFCASSA
jgi:hypothetical protein